MLNPYYTGSYFDSFSCGQRAYLACYMALNNGQFTPREALVFFGLTCRLTCAKKLRAWTDLENRSNGTFLAE